MAIVSIEDVDRYLAGLIGQKISSVTLRKNRSISIGFGPLLEQQAGKRSVGKRSEWELGSYYPGWRLTTGERIVCASHDLLELREIENRMKTFLTGVLKEIFFGFSLNTRFITEDYCFEFLPAVATDGDELVHLFGPDSLCLSMADGLGMALESSDKPFQGLYSIKRPSP